MNLSSLKTASISHIIAGARLYECPPPSQVMPDEIQKLDEAIPLGEAPTWAKYLHNYKGMLIRRINEINSENTADKNSKKELQKEWNYLFNLFNEIDKYLQTNLKQEFSNRSESEKCKFLILDGWQLFGKPSNFA